MKTLYESLFDSDLATKNTPIEKILQRLDKKSLETMPDDEMLDIVDIINNSGKTYTVQEIKNHPVDLSKHIMIAIRKNLRVWTDASEVCRYVYYFNLSNKYWNKISGMLQNLELDDKPVVITGLRDGRVSGNFYWEFLLPWLERGRSVNVEKNVEKHWKGFISNINRYYSGCDFIVLDEYISKELIKIILDNY